MAKFTKSSDYNRQSEESLLTEFRPTQEKEPTRNHHYYAIIIPWVFCSILSVLLTASLGLRSEPCIPKNFWAPTEIEPITRELPATTKETLFTAALKYNEAHELYRPVNPNGPEYVGIPSSEIDAAWDDLIGGNSAVNIFVSEEEAKLLGGGLYLDPASGLYMAEVTVFHDLHCLNMIRQSLRLDYYTPEKNMTAWPPHLDHCIDSLRQSLMCTGDMTLSPIIWTTNGNRFIPNFEVIHTCRDYDSLKVWANNRDSADPDHWEENAARFRASFLKGGSSIPGPLGISNVLWD